MKNDDNNFTKFQQTNESILNSLREESLSNNREITDEYLSSAQSKHKNQKSIHGAKAEGDLNNMYQQFKIKQSNNNGSQQGQNPIPSNIWLNGYNSSFSAEQIEQINEINFQNNYYQNLMPNDYQVFQFGGNMTDLIQASYFNQQNDLFQKNQMDNLVLDQFNQKLRKSIKNQQIGLPYNTKLKNEIVKRAHLVMKPYDQVKYINKLGSPPKPNTGKWITSSHRSPKTASLDNKNRTQKAQNILSHRVTNNKNQQLTNQLSSIKQKPQQIQKYNIITQKNPEMIFENHFENIKTDQKESQQEKKFGRKLFETSQNGIIRELKKRDDDSTPEDESTIENLIIKQEEQNLIDEEQEYEEIENETQENFIIQKQTQSQMNMFDIVEDPNVQMQEDQKQQADVFKNFNKSQDSILDNLTPLSKKNAKRKVSQGKQQLPKLKILTPLQENPIQKHKINQVFQQLNSAQNQRIKQDKGKLTGIEFYQNDIYNNNLQKFQALRRLRFIKQNLGQQRVSIRDKNSSFENVFSGKSINANNSFVYENQASNYKGSIDQGLPTNRTINLDFKNQYQQVQQNQNGIPNKMNDTRAFKIFTQRQQIFEKQNNKDFILGFSKASFPYIRDDNEKMWSTIKQEPFQSLNAVVPKQRQNTIDKSKNQRQKILPIYLTEQYLESNNQHIEQLEAFIKKYNQDRSMLIYNLNRNMEQIKNQLQNPSKSFQL